MKGICFANVCSLCLGIILLAIGCSKEPEAHSIINVGDQYEIRLNQVLSEEGGLPALHITTLEPQMCINTHISIQTIISEQKIKIFLNDVFVEGECIPGNQLISEDVLLTTEREAIPFEISLKNAIDNKGILYADDLELELVLNDFDGLKISKTHINKIRPDMFWGSFSVSDNSVADQLKQFLQESDNGDTKLKGDYGHFYLSQDEEVVVYDNDNEFTFLVSTDLTIPSIKAKMEEFKEMDSSLIFTATNYDGSTVNIH